MSNALKTITEALDNAGRWAATVNVLSNEIVKTVNDIRASFQDQPQQRTDTVEQYDNTVLETELGEDGAYHVKRNR